MDVGAPMVLPSAATLATVGDDAVCGPCCERNGRPWRQGDPIEHPACENPNGCRCVVSVEIEPLAQPPAGAGREQG